MFKLLCRPLKRMFIWRKKSYFYLFVFLCLALNLSSQEAFRVWTDVKGRTVNARFYKFSGSNIIIERQLDKRKLPFPVSQLSPSDQNYLRTLKTKLQTSSGGGALDRSSFRSMLVKEKWTNKISVGLQRIFFDFELDKVDADRDGSPEGQKVLVEQMWFQGREAFLGAKKTGGQGCVGYWDVNDQGELEVTLLKCYPDKKSILYWKDARGIARDGTNYLTRYGYSRFYYAGFPPTTICFNERPHSHSSECGCPFKGSGTWRYNAKTKGFVGSSNEDDWRATIYPYKRAIELK
jgi:hypothetical protein